MTKIKENFIYNLVYQVLLVVSPLITMPFLARSLGVNGVGGYSYAYSLLSYFVLAATLGCDIYGRREISYTKDNREDLTNTFWRIQTVKVISTLLVLCFYCVFSAISKNKVLLFMLIFHLLNVPLNISWFYQGIENFKKITIRGLIIKMLDILFVVLFIHTPNDLTLYTLGSSIIAFMSFAALWIDIKKYINKPKLHLKEIRYSFKEALIFFLPSIAASIYTLLDKTMLGAITGAYTENGYYEQAQKINIILLRVVLALGAVLLPQIANAHKQNNRKKVSRLILKSLNYVYFVSFAIAFELIIVSDVFVPWFFGQEFQQVSILLKFSGFILVFQGIDDVLGMQYLVSTGHQKEYVKTLFCGAAINFVCNLLLIPVIYSSGALIASLIGEISICVYQYLLIKKRLDLSSTRKSAMKYLISGIAITVLFLPLSRIVPTNIVGIIILSVFPMLSYCAIIILLKDDFSRSLLKTLITKKHS